MFKKMQNRKGFTLIEMMAVIAIVAVLVSITVPIVGKARIKAQAAADAANLRSISATIATKYVTTTDGKELRESIENPTSQLNPGASVVCYKVGSEVVSLYVTSVFQATLDRVQNTNPDGTSTVSGYGLGWNGQVAQTGDPDSATLDTVTGEYLFTVLDIAAGDATELLTNELDKIAEMTINNLLNDLVNDWSQLDDHALEGASGIINAVKAYNELADTGKTSTDIINDMKMTQAEYCLKNYGCTNSATHGKGFLGFGAHEHVTAYNSYSAAIGALDLANKGLIEN